MFHIRLGVGIMLIALLLVLPNWGGEPLKKPGIC